jgi:uncharacterized protein YecE (DUF72 family)
MPAVHAVTGDWAVVRFHGRNRAGWERAGATTDQRYDYRYSVDELRPWAEMVKQAAGRVDRFFAMFNNHAGGNMAKDAQTLRELLEGRGHSGQERG